MESIILSINAGSSSLKCSLYKTSGSDKNITRLGNAEVAAIGQQPKLKYSTASQKNERNLDNVRDHKDAFRQVLEAFLNDDEVGIKSKDEIEYACHRVVQGGDFRDDELITKETFHKIESLSDLAPL